LSKLPSTILDNKLECLSLAKYFSFLFLLSVDKALSTSVLKAFPWRHKIQYNDTQHIDTNHIGTQNNDTQHIDTWHNNTQHNDAEHNDAEHNDTQHNDTQHIDNQNSDTRQKTNTAL
jgi:hypothetical protein